MDDCKLEDPLGMGRYILQWNYIVLEDIECKLNSLHWSGRRKLQMEQFAIYAFQNWELEDTDCKLDDVILNWKWLIGNWKWLIGNWKRTEIHCRRKLEDNWN